MLVPWSIGCVPAHLLRRVPLAARLHALPRLRQAVPHAHRRHLVQQRQQAVDVYPTQRVAAGLRMSSAFAQALPLAQCALPHTRDWIGYFLLLSLHLQPDAVNNTMHMAPLPWMMLCVVQAQREPTCAAMSHTTSGSPGCSTPSSTHTTDRRRSSCGGSSLASCSASRTAQGPRPSRTAFCSADLSTDSPPRHRPSLGSVLLGSSAAGRQHHMEGAEGRRIQCA